MKNLKIRAASAVGHRLRTRIGRIACVCLMAGATTACVVPNSMHVTEGIAPTNIDTQVRFRTTYYFRTFDYCWAADDTYRKIVPETDTLYRYRMTGKAPSLTNKIKFESGELDASVIAPFGVDTVYNSDIGGHLVRTQSQAREEAEEKAAARERSTVREAALDRFNALLAILGKMDASKQAVEVEQIKAAMKKTLDEFTGTLEPQLSGDLATRLNTLQQTVDRLETKLTSSPSSTPVPVQTDLDKARTLFTEEVTKQIAALREDLKINARGVTTCPLDQKLKRGFQIMGPEGFRPFDQEKRLVMAMSSSAKPLIETLNEYSGRLLKPQINPAEQLLPLARETASVFDAQRAVYQQALIVQGQDPATARIDTLFKAAMDAFTPKAK